MDCFHLEFWWDFLKYSFKHIIVPLTWRTVTLTSLQVPLSASMSPIRLHSSNPNLCAELVDFQPPVSRLTDSVECSSDYTKLQEEFCTIAQKGGWIFDE